ncbi:MAG: sulfite exporter TauE/SafE family protein [Porticoccaceae bacterium]|jgi:uncharacterized protein|nr:sulfite exporter TauE/SafE family protein [Porticoccaceae bacterium]
MCGGIAASFATGAQSRGLSSALLFNSGRLISYAILGGLAGFLVSGMSMQMSSLQFAVRCLAGLMLIAMGLYISGWWYGLSRLEKLAMPLWRKIQPAIAQLQKRGGLGRFIVLGLLWGFLPCGLIYSSLIWASASGTAFSSATLMVFMGLGTLPALLSVGYFGGQLLRAPLLRKVSGVLLILYGFWTLVVPVQHLYMYSQMMEEGEGSHQMNY